MDIKGVLLRWFINFLIKKTSGGAVKNGSMSNQESAEELHKPVIKKIKKQKVYLSIKGNVWGADLVDMQLISKLNKGFRFLLCVIDIYSKYAWVFPLKDNKGITITNSYQKKLDESNRNPNKIWVDKGSKFYNRLMKPWLQDNYIEMYSRNNDWKSVVAERFIRTLKDKFYKYMTPVSKNVYIETKPADVKSSTYIDFVIENNEKDPKLEVGDQVRISKYKNIFAKGNVPNLSEEVL